MDFRGMLRGPFQIVDRDRAQMAFDEYVRSFDMGDPRVALKYEHTARVAALCEEIAVGLGMSAGDVDLAWLCGLLHDIGRFEQLRIWGTFGDAISCSHARMGLAVLDGADEFEGNVLSGADGRLGRFADANAVGVSVRPAVAVHSELRLPDGLDGRTRVFCEVVRDADKVDILRVFSESNVRDVLGLTAEEFADGEISDAAMTGFREGRCLGPADRRANLDGLVGAICLPFELVFEPSRYELDGLGYLRELVDRPFGLEPRFSSEDTNGKYKEIRRGIEFRLSNK